MPYQYEDDELRSGPGIGGLRVAPLCRKCKGSGRLLYEVTNHGERNERVWDKCNGCGGTGREGKPQPVKGYSTW